MPALTGFQKTLRLSAPLRLSPLFPHAPDEAFPACRNFAQNNYLNLAKNRILISALKHHNKPK